MDSKIQFIWKKYSELSTNDLYAILNLRQQVFVSPKQWLKRMISHHSTALTTSHKIYNKTSNPKLKKLAKEIIDTQEKEIQLMKTML